MFRMKLDVQAKISFVQGKTSFVVVKTCFVQVKTSFVQVKTSFVQVKTRSGSRESEGSTTAGVGSTPTPTPGPSRSRRSSRPISSRGASPSLPSLEEEKEYKVNFIVSDPCIDYNT